MVWNADGNGLESGPVAPGSDPPTGGADPEVDVVLVGVGGQGSVTATEVLGRAAALAGLRVATSEVHGMAQRGGTVVTTVRFGRAVRSPDVPRGEADVVVAFEGLEGLRAVGWLRRDGLLILNRQRIVPTVESLKKAPYPADPEALARRAPVRLVPVPALEIARELGSPKLVGTVLLGTLSRELVAVIPPECFEEALRGAVPAGTEEANVRAFRKGVTWWKRQKAGVSGSSDVMARGPPSHE